MQRICLQNLPSSHFTISVRTDADLYHQITRVLRMTLWDTLAFFEDGKGDYIYSITQMSRDSVELEFVSESPVVTDTSPIVRLYQALPNKLDKIEYILQKGCEIGVSEFVFFASERSNAPHWIERKMERLNDILREATEQSGGIHIPTLLFAQSIPDDLEGAIIAHTLDGGQSLSSTQLQDLYTLVIGPEGGWSNTEITHMQSLGACTTKCGTRILRTETAGVVIAFYLRNRG